MTDSHSPARSSTPHRPVRLRSIAAWCGVGLLAALLAVLLNPVQVGLAGIWPLDLLISFRSVLGLLLCLGSAALFVVVLAARRRRRAMLLAFAIVLGLGGIGQLAVQGLRGSQNSAVPETNASITVLSFNTFTSVDAEGLADVVDAAGAQIVVLPETNRSTAQAVASRLTSAGADFEVFGEEVIGAPVVASALLVDRRLGTYRMGPRGSTLLHSFVVEREGTGDGPDAIGVVHTVNPLRPRLTSRWLTETQWAVDTCNSTPGIVIAGDFNATRDHPALAELGKCLDAASADGMATTGTWPSSFPPLLASPIDHILADADAWQVTSFEVLDPAIGSDHRPIVARLTPAAGS